MHKHASANRFYRLVWSTVHRCWVAVAEGTRSHGKGGARRRAAAVVAASLAASAAAAGVAPPSNALPTGMQVVAGQAGVNVQGNNMTVSQATQQAILNWQGFNVGADAQVRFNQPNASAVALNRVVGGGASEIFGKLSSNGKVFLVNPQGVLFGAGAQVDVGGLVATSLGISDQDFLAGSYRFSGIGAGSVRNEGSINASGGVVALLAPAVSNSGNITARHGSVALAAGNAVGLDFRGDGLITVRVEQGALDALAENKGLLQADGGQVLLTAKAADALARSTVNNAGVVQARGLVAEGGTIRLVGDGLVQAGQLDASSSKGQGGSVSVAGGFVSLGGAVRADGVRGGGIEVKAAGDLSAASALSASGTAGKGGSIALSAGATLAENNAASANVAGATDGGAMSLQAAGSLLSSGQHDAHGATGQGGRVDISGADVRLMGATVDASGAHQGGLVRVGGAFQGGAQRADAPDADRFTARWGATASIANADATFINDSTVLDVSARGAAGQGGTAIIWSQKQTTMLGALKATGAVRGGAVEISSHEQLRHVGLDRLAIGAGGRLLLDPKDIVIGDFTNQWTYDAIIGKGFSGGKNVDVSSLKDGEGFGYSVALTSDGKGMAVGAPFNEGTTTPATNNYGAVRLFTFNDTKFGGGTLVGTVGYGYTGNNNYNMSGQLTGADMFGSSVALNSTGTVMAVGALGTERVYTFGFNTGFTSPSLNQTLTSHNGAGTGFGVAVALNGAGDKLAVGALLNNSVEFYSKSGTFGYLSTITGGNAAESQFGTALALNDAGTQLAVGAPGEDSGRGAVYLYTTPFATPTLKGKIGQGGDWMNIALNESELFGSSLAMNDAGTRLAVGAPGNGGLGNTAPGPGAVRIFDYTGDFAGLNISAIIGRDYTQGVNASLDNSDFGNFGFALAMNGAGDALVVSQPFENSFDGSTVASGTMSMFRLLPAPSASSLSFDQAYPKNLVNASVDAQKLAAALAGGTDITLQANNDITWLAGSAINASGGNGNLTLQAGRSVALNSNVTMGGTLGVVANAGTGAGVVNAYRNAGAATITVANGTTINAGNVNLKIDTGAGQTNSDSGAITVNGIVTGKTVKVTNLGPSAGSDVVIGSNGKLVGSGGNSQATVVVVVAGDGGGTFTNNAFTNTGLDGGAAGFYNVYSDSPVTTKEGMTGYAKLYNRAYSATLPGLPINYFFYKYQPTLTVTAQNSTKTYDGTSALPTVTYNVTGYIDGDSNNLAGSVGAVNFTKNVGVYGYNIGSLNSSLGYKINLVNSGSLTVTKRALTVTATGVDKVYDGLVGATVTTGDNRVANDTLTIARNASFSSKDVGTGKTVSVSGISISGADAGNYSLSNTTASTTANITKRTLNVTATASNKVYDGGSFASMSLGSDRVGADAVFVNAGSTSFVDKNVGTGKTAQATGLSIFGADSGNYSLASTTASTTANITKRQLSVGLLASDKVYDGAVAATGSYSDNRILNDVLTVSGNATFANKNVGNGKTVTATGLSLSGTDAGNYSLASTTATGTAAITPRALTVTATGNNKVYDGSVAATVNFGDDRVAGDALGLTGTASFGTKDAGNGKAISVSGISLSGADSGNYTLANNSASATGNIAQRTLNVTATGVNKTYDGSATATVGLTDDRVTNDVLSVSGGASFGDKNVGTGKTVSVTGISLSGADAANYSLASTTASSSADITARSLTVTATGIDRVYDGGNTASVTFGDNRVGGDTLSISGNASFGDKNVGTGKTVSVGGIALSGADAGNYSLTATTAGTTANITQRTLNVSATAANKVYDGGVNATVSLTDDRVSGDTFAVSKSGATFADKNVGTGKTVTANGLSLSGADAGNYALGATSASTTADITPRQLTVGLTAADKVYDGAVAAAASYTDDRVVNDALTVSGTATFGDKNVGAGKTVTANGLSLSGADANNYTLASTTATSTAAITPRALVVTTTGNNKVYDGGNAATVNFSDDRVVGDVLGVSGGASFGDKNVGTSKTVSVTGISLSGADAGNYSLASTSASSSADITARSLTVTATGIDRVYDGGNAASVTFGDNRVGGDALGISGNASFGDKNVGTGKTVSVGGIALSGADAGNYSLTATTAGTTANITQRTLNVSATAGNKVYDGGVNAVASLGDDRVSGDTLTVSQTGATFADKNVGTGKTVTANGLSLSGADAANYALGATSASTTADITPRQLTVGLTAADKVYDGAVAAAASYTDDRVANDALTVSGTATFGDKNVGSGKTVTANGLSLSGADANNYTLASTTATSTAAITPRALVVTATGNNKVYDGGNAATVNFSDDRVTNDVLSVSGGASFGDKNVGTGKTVSVTGITLSGADAGNYSLASTSASSSADITARNLTVTATGIDRVYDGGNTASVSFGDNRVAGDTLSISGNASFGDENVGTGKTVSVGGIALSGADAGNYSLTATTAGTTANITQRTLNVSATAGNKVYDGGVSATVSLTDDRVGGDTFAVNQSGATFADKNVGTGKTVTANGLSLSGADANNYTLVSTTATSTAAITPRALVVTTTGNNKVYDGGNIATVNFSDDRVTNDVLSVSGGASFGDKNVGTGKTVSVTGITLSGADAGNYSLASTSASSSADITARSLTVTATGIDRVYDGGNTASVTFGDNRVGGDTLSISGNASFGDKNVGTGKTVSVGGIALSGADAGNYSLTATTAGTTANITQRTLNVSATAGNKVYDGGVTATASLGDDRVSGDTLTVNQTGATFGDKNVGTGKTVTANGLSLSGADAANYALGATSASTTADITPRQLTVGLTAADKVYDGAVAAAASYTDDRVVNDALTVSGTATFGDKNVGAGKTVTANGLSLSGADANNYSLASTTATSTAAITPRALVVTATGNNKVYDGGNAATVNFSDDRVVGDVLGVSGGASFGDKNVGTGKTVSVTGITLSGADAGNYSLASTSAASSADITARSLTVTATGIDRVYDGGNTASVTFGDNRVAGDTLSISGNASFGDKNVGTGKTVSVGGIALSGADAGNYSLTATTAGTTANITQRTLNVSATAGNKVYDGGVNATVSLTDDRVSGDTFAVSKSGATFADKNVGTGKTVTANGLSLSGADAANYALGATSASTTADITPRQLTVGLTAADKVYDGAVAAAVSYSDNRVSGDVLGLSGNATFADKNVGAGKTVTANGLSLSGADANNYTLASTTATSTAAITPRALTVTATGNNKVYDGGTAATVNFVDNRVAGDVLGISGAASFGDKNVGATKAVSVTGISLSGADAGNYSLASTTASGSADITARSLTVTATGIDRVYDGGTAASVNFGDNRVIGDALTISGNASFGDKNAGDGKAVSVGSIVLSGADAGNYSLAATTAGATANITKRALNVNATAANKVYDGGVNASTSLSDNRVSGDTLTVNQASAVFVDKNAGASKNVQVTGLSLSGADAGNYTLGSTSASATADITRRSLTATAAGADKVYDGTTAVNVSYADNRLVGDTLSINGNAAFADKNAGNGKAINVTGLALTGADAGNYVLANTNASAQANIARRSLTVSANGNTKVYDGNAVAALSLADNRIAGDALALSANGSFSDKNAGSGKTVTATGITVTGADAANYQLTSTTASGTGTITPRALTANVAAVDKVYDGTAGAAVVLASDDRVAGDRLELTGGVGSFADKNAGNGKAVALSGVSVGGADAGNYDISIVAKQTANIAKRALNVSATGIDKVYDGSKAAQVSFGDNRLAGDALQVAGLATFADKNAGKDKAVSVNELSLSGADAGNYAISNAGVSTKASITPKALEVKANDQVRAYGAANPALTWTSTGFVGGDTAALLDGVQTGTAATRESPAGTYAINIGGNSLANYAVSYVNGVMTVQRAPQEINNAIGNAVNPVMPVVPVAAGQGGTVGPQLANDGGTLVPMPAPIAPVISEDVAAGQPNPVNPGNLTASATPASPATPGSADAASASVNQANPASPATPAEPARVAANGSAEGEQQQVAQAQGPAAGAPAQPQPQPQLRGSEVRELMIGGGSRVMVRDGGVNTAGAPN